MTRTAAEVEAEVESSRGNLDRTVEALKDKMSPGQLVDEVSSMLGGSSKQVLAKLGEQAKENPMPLAVIGLGLAWLMMGSSKNSPPEDSYAAPQRPYPGGSNYAEEGDYTSLKDKVTDKLQGAAHSMADAAGSTRDTLGRTASGTADRMSSLATSAADRTSSLASNAADKASLYGRQVQQKYLDTLQSEPLILGAVALAVGLAVGAALPATEIEDRYIGGVRDDVVDKVHGFAEEHLQTAKDVATTAYTSVKDEIQHQAEGGADTSLADKAGEVARAGAAAVQDKLHGEG
jgi:hypothetical protein